MSGLGFDNWDEIEEEITFTLVGLAICPEFQKCLAYIELLHRNFPNIFLKPFIRPMLEFDWFEYLCSAQRNFGNKFWHLDKPIIVCANKIFIGHDDDLVRFISKKYHMKLMRDYDCLAKRGVVDIYEKYLELGRKFVYLTISINKSTIGHLIFMLYADLVPKTCKNFIKNCNNKYFGYAGSQIHRIMDRSWIQFADFKMSNSSRTCENYKIPHNRRGVISMCNNGRHTDNTTQFFVCLNPTPWMDYRYVAFGQMVQGELVLRQLEKIKTYYEYPSPDLLTISGCGEISLKDTVDAKNVAAVEKYIIRKQEGRDQPTNENIIDIRDKSSTLLEMNFLLGLYSNVDDNMSHLPMLNLPDYLLPTPPSSSTSSISYYLKESEEESHREDIALIANDIDNYDYMYSLLNDFLLSVPFGLDLDRKDSELGENEEKIVLSKYSKRSKVQFVDTAKLQYMYDSDEEEDNNR